MKIIHQPKLITKTIHTLRQKGQRVGFVPTMGALHEGHLSLVRQARKNNDVVVVSIFVNPTQFGPKEDLKKYPRPKAKDQNLLRKEKVDFLFNPTAKGMYPEGYRTFVGEKQNASLNKLAGKGAHPKSSHLLNTLCGKSRPGHFQGVMTVVLKLINITTPDRIYFGAKDYQQAVIIRKMITDLNLNTEMHLCPIVREKDGLAMSSRNRYLNPKDRKRATLIYKVLMGIKSQVKKSPKQDMVMIVKRAKNQLRSEGIRLDYLEFVDPQTLHPLKQFQRKMMVVCACFVGKTRLIDNVTITA